jgi:hypothetical protein
MDLAHRFMHHLLDTLLSSPSEKVVRYHLAHKNDSTPSQ